ncbi:GTP-binding protein 1-like protein [Endogone sp. FLAS-F59071]|nr:GTP-binding protein 1-like protein [Endogone sp. FLAS-F59071]|eukprot:RUS21544.1 GTP-binding protein 1-like protein [Endogone sp. FLAS-F59071]
MSRTPSPWTEQSQISASLPPEVDNEGNIEYKLKLVDPSPERFEHLVTQLKWRLAEGGGEAMYEIGVSDDGSFVGLSSEDMAASVDTLRRMASLLDADVSIIREVTVDQPPTTINTTTGNASSRYDPTKELISLPGNKVVEALVRRRLTEDQQFMEIRVAMVGGQDAGKSTLLGYLTHGVRDNGRGRARLNLLRHRHEIETGRTSSISHEIIGYDSAGVLVNYATTHITTWEQICESSSKIITFLDTCGHPRYLRTTIAGLTGHAPDYACLIVSANAGGVPDMTREHLALTVMLAVPVFVVVTKIDVATADQLKRTIGSLLGLLKAPGNRKMPVVVKNEDDLVAGVSNFAIHAREIPIFLVSSVTGANMNLLSKLFNLLPKPVRNLDQLLEEPVEFQIEEVYAVPDVGYVVGGVLRAGRINMHSPLTQRTYHFGPDASGQFIPVTVTSIHRHRMPASHIHTGQAATLAIEGADLVPVRLRKGTVLLGADHPDAYYEFDAELFVLYHSAQGLSAGFQGMVHAGSVRQTARVVSVVRATEAEGSDPKETVSLPPSRPPSAPILPTDATPISASAPSSLLLLPPDSSPMTRSRSSPVRNKVPQSPPGSPRRGATPRGPALKTGERGEIRFRFVHQPEHLRVGAQVLFREGRTKCLGKVVRIVRGMEGGEAVETENGSGQ